jgi:surfactin synthase thioesterase subunit
MDRLDLFLVPYAGGAAAVFREWKSRLPAWINPVPLTLPARGARHGEPILHDWPPLVGLLSDEIGPRLTGRFAFFGHSLGALVALELAYAMRERFGKMPGWLGVSGCIAPSRRERKIKWLDCPEDEFLDELRSLQGTSPELLQNRELLELVMPVLRADFHLAGTYEHRDRPPLGMPMLVMGGTQDADVVSVPENLSSWCMETTGSCRVEMIEGGHFFVDSHREQVIQAIARDLERVSADAGRVHA